MNPRSIDNFGLLLCVVDNIGANPGLTALWEDERQRRREQGESTDIAPPGSQGTLNTG